MTLKTTIVGLLLLAMVGCSTGKSPKIVCEESRENYAGNIVTGTWVQDPFVGWIAPEYYGSCHWPTSRPVGVQG